MARNPVVGLVERVFSIERRFLTWVFHRDDAWENWVDETLHDAIRFTARAYVILTWDIANFSYFAASFSHRARVWAQWLAWTRIPFYYHLARVYARHERYIERHWRRVMVRHVYNVVTRHIDRVDNRLTLKIAQETAARKAEIAHVYAILLAYIAKVANELQRQITAEVIARKQAIAALRAQLLQIIAKLQAQVNAIIPFINSQAADGYNGTRKSQGGIISRLLQDVAVDNPVARDLIGRLVSLILDLIEVDDPAARILGGLLLRQVIDRLGVDKLAGGLADALLSDLLGGGKPKTLKDVETSVGNRLNSGEAQWQQFYANGGDDLEKLGNEMRESSSLAFTVPLAAYFAGAVADPKGTAAATDAAVTPAVRAILGPIVSVFGNL